MADVIREKSLQVRGRLDPAALKRYAERAAAGHEAPPIMVGRCRKTGALYLVDGWHRIEAGALVRDPLRDDSVRAKVADLSMADIRWQAAAANMNHGVPLKSADYRRVLSAFIKAGNHRGPRGKVMSYRDMAEVIGKPHTTIRRWIERDHRSLFLQIGGNEGGNHDAMPPAPELQPSPEEQLCAEAVEAMEVVRSRLPGMGAEQRGLLVEHLRDALAVAERLGIAEAAY